MYRHARTLCLLLGLCMAAAAFAGAPARQSVWVAGDLYLGADGTVERAVLDEGTAPQVQAIVESAMRNWRFQPVLRDGVPTPVRTAMTMSLEGVPVEGGYKLRVAQLEFSQARARHARIVLPQLNTRLDVLTALRIDAAGNVVDAAVVYMGGARGRIDPVRRNMMGDEIVKALKKSKFRPAELAYGEAADDTFFLPLNYRIAGTGGAEDDLRDHVKDMKPIPWLVAAEQPKPPEDAAMAAGGAIALHSDQVKLQSDVVGKIL